MEEFKKAVKINPVYVEARNNMAGMYYALSLYKEAAREFQIVLQLAPDNLDARVNLAGVYYALRQFEDSAKEYEIYLKENYLDTSAWYDLGTAYYYSGDKVKASQAFSRVLAYDAKHQEAISALAQVRAEIDKEKQ